MEQDGFKVVRNKRGHRKKAPGLKRTTVIGDTTEPDIDKSSVVSRIEAARSDLLSSAYWTEFVSVSDVSLRQVQTIFCFGLGHFSDSVTAKYQLALLLCIQHNYGIHHIQLSDPIFYQCEKDLLREEYRLDVITENLECCQPCSQPSLVFLPHCPKQMTNNLLFSNWEPGLLSNLSLISNSISNINMTQDLYFIQTAITENFVEEKSLKNIFKYQDIFNDLSLHLFNASKINSNSPLWRTFSKPQYSDEEVEFITANKKLF